MASVHRRSSTHRYSYLKQDGIETVQANGNGFSAFDHLTPIMKKPGKKIWCIKKGAQIPSELKLVKDKRPGHEGHYMIAPANNMPLKKYLGGARRARTRQKPRPVTSRVLRKCFPALSQLAASGACPDAAPPIKHLRACPACDPSMDRSNRLFLNSLLVSGVFQMSVKGFHPIVSEYHLLWEALKCYESRLEKLSAMSTDEDQQLKYDEKIQDLQGILQSLKIAAKDEYQLVLG